MKTIIILCLSVFPILATALDAKKYHQKPKLVVVLVIDQFRGDYLTRFKDQFLPEKKSDGSFGGFQFLMSKGAYFPFGEYEMLQDMTGPGHATIATGAYPYRTGVPINYWYSVEKGDTVYCAEDEASKTVGEKSPRKHVGTSPKNLEKATSFTDELKNAGYSSRVVSIALKDRASIFMGGHRADLAMWMDSETNQWTTSTYYLPKAELPEWVKTLNEDLKAVKGKKYVWKESKNKSGLSSKPFEGALNIKKLKSFGAMFPHEIEEGSYESASSPLGIEWTAAAAKKAVDSFGLGSQKHTDVLFVSFSSHDYVGHTFGTNSQEIEEMTLVEDKNISDLINHINKKVPGGVKNVTFVLTADHGVATNPEYLMAHKIRAGRHDEKKMLEAVNKKLAEKYGAMDKGHLVHVSEYNFYLNKKVAEERKADLAQIEKMIKEELKKFDGVAYVISHKDIQEKKLPFGPLEKQALRTYVPGRSGDFIVIPDPNFFPGDDATTHMTGYNYDKVVPIIFNGSHFKPGVYTDAKVVDIAPTLSFLLGVVPPTASEGKVLPIF
jgi:predicted AlkP superfamily pyrophosphatase or phosphodiesterase